MGAYINETCGGNNKKKMYYILLTLQENEICLLVNMSAWDIRREILFLDLVMFI